MRLWLALSVLAVAVVACGSPSPSERVVVQVDPVVAEVEPTDLPAPVVEAVAQLTEIAESGSPWDMARLARRTPGFYSNAGGLEHAEYWYLKYRSGDWPMEHLSRVLDYEPALIDGEAGQVYVWPYMATLAPTDMSAKTLRDVEDLLGPQAVDQIAAGSVWPGYRLGVAPDGTWLYFYTGAD